jgi:4a-hydroxytetrahydrobiopterin dehydratase
VPAPQVQLDDLTIRRELSRLPGWSRRGNVLTKTYTFREFMDGIAFVNAAAGEAERMNHHPDIDIRYTKVTVNLTTHDAGGITQKDVELAVALESAACRE